MAAPFVDTAKITVRSGNGGNGVVSFHREKYVAAGGPDGGDGGRGGNIVVEVNDHMSTLMDFRYKRKYVAGNGGDGSGKRCTGRDGEDLVLKVPRGTIIRDAETREIIRDMSDDRPFILCKGGRGGWGNKHFATPTRQVPRFAKAGLPGESRDVVLELKLPGWGGKVLVAPAAPPPFTQDVYKRQVVVVGEAAQAGLQSADDQGDVPKNLPHPVGVDNGGVVGAQARPPSGGVGVVMAALFGGSVVGHHGVDIARGEEHPQPGPPQGGKGFRVPPVGLGQHGHPIALGLQHPADDSRTEGGVVHIGVPGNQQKVIKVPAPALHILDAHRQEPLSVKTHGHFLDFMKIRVKQRAVLAPGPPPPPMGRQQDRAPGPIMIFSRRANSIEITLSRKSISHQGRNYHCFLPSRLAP